MSVFQLKTFADIFTSVREELQIPSTDQTLINRIKRDINIVYAEVVSRKNWWWLKGYVDLTFPAYTNAGTASVTQNSPLVTLSVPPASSKAGYFFAIDGYSEIYKINFHTAGTTTFQLNNIFTGTTNTAINYKIWTEKVALPADCKETTEAWHDYYRQPMENVGFPEFRKISSLIKRNESYALKYCTGDYVDPTQYIAIPGLPSLSSRSSNLMRKSLIFSSSVPSAIVASVNSGDPVKWHISGASHPSYDGDVFITQISTTSVANDTVTYTGVMEYTEAPTVDTGLVVQAISQEQDYNRYRELFIYPSLMKSPYTLHIDYAKEALPLNNDSDEPLIPYQDRLVLRYGALALAWAKLRNEAESARNRQLYEQKLAQMEGKWQDSTPAATLKPSKDYLNAKRTQSRRRIIDSDLGSVFASGSLSGQTITGTPNMLATFGLDGVLTATSITATAINSLSGLTSNVQQQLDGKQSTTLASGHILVGNSSNVATDTALTGDVAVTNTGIATVNTVGSSTASSIHSAEQLANAATSASTASTLVKRDGSGNFSAGTITATLAGNATNVTGTVAIANGGTGQTTANTALNALLPSQTGNANKMLQSDGSNTSWIAAMTNPMTTGGDVIYGGASGVPTRLANGSVGQVLQSQGSTNAPAWASYLAPTIQRFTTAGSATYTRPTPAPLYIRVKAMGPGGGGGGGGSGAGTGGNPASNTTFGTLITAGAGLGGGDSLHAGGAGGTGTVNAGATTIINVAGGQGQGGNGGTPTGAVAGAGGSSFFGGAGASAINGSAGSPAAANSGSGGQGGSGTTGSIAMGGGGGAGAYVEAIITSIATSYSLNIGPSGAGGTAGTSGTAGGAGAAGQIVVEEYYQ